MAKLVTGTNPSAIYTVAVQEDTAPASSCWRHLIAWGAAGTNGTRVVEKGCNSADAFVETYDSWMSVASPPSWPTSTASLFDGIITSSTVSAYQEGELQYTISAANNTGTGSGAALGESPWGGGFWKGRIAEVVVLARNPSAAEHRSIQEYLARKWGLTVTPAAAQTVTAVAGGSSGTATVSWAAPSWNGGAAVSSYTATSSTGSRTCTTAGTSCTVTGLTPGQSYTFTVRATNSVGAGPASTASNSVTAP